MSNLYITWRACINGCFQQGVERGEILATDFRDVRSQQACGERRLRDGEVVR